MEGSPDVDSHMDTEMGNTKKDADATNSASLGEEEDNELADGGGVEGEQSGGREAGEDVGERDGDRARDGGEDGGLRPEGPSLDEQRQRALQQMERERMAVMLKMVRELRRFNADDDEADEGGEEVDEEAFAEGFTKIYLGEGDTGGIGSKEEQPSLITMMDLWMEPAAAAEQGKAGSEAVVAVKEHESFMEVDLGGEDRDSGIEVTRHPSPTCPPDNHAPAHVPENRHLPSVEGSADVIVKVNDKAPVQTTFGGVTDFSDGGMRQVPFDDAAGENRHPVWKVVAASAIGNILEWYDFGVFAYFAPEIGSLFFPKTDETSGILSAFVVFGGAFFFRPMGGLIFGYIGDKYGRKIALYVSVMMMATSTFLMGCLPTYYMAGLFAPFLLCLCRVFQGLSVGGELVGSLIYAVESSAPNRKCLVGSMCMVGAILGLELGSLVGLLIHAVLEPEAVREWGWRIPFFSGVLIGVFALWIRSGLHESLEFEESVHARKAAENEEDGKQSTMEMKEVQVTDGRNETLGPHENLNRHVSDMTKALMVIPDKVPLFTSVRRHPLEVLAMTIVAGCFGLGVWLLTAFPPSLYQDLMHPPLGQPRSVPNSTDDALTSGRRAEGGAMFDAKHLGIWEMHTGLLAVMVFSQAVFGWLGDLFGNVRLMLIGTACVSIMTMPCFYGMGVGTYASAAWGQGMLLTAMGIIGGNLPAWMVTAFPVEVRFTAIAVGYNAGQAIFGGTAGVFATLIYKQTHTTALIGLYHSAVCACAFAMVVLLQRHKRSQDNAESLPDAGLPAGVIQAFGSLQATAGTTIGSLHHRLATVIKRS